MHRAVRIILQGSWRPLCQWAMTTTRRRTLLTARVRTTTQALLRAPARVVTRSVVTGLHYNSLIRSLHDPLTTSVVRDLYFIAQAALMRAKKEEGAPRDFYMKETLRNEERIAAYAERIGKILREAEDLESEQVRRV